jgi:hypothetical protein
MKLTFKNNTEYQNAKTLLGGNGYRFAYYIDELAIRFYTTGSFFDAVASIGEIGIREHTHYSVDSEGYRMSALENGWSAG